MEYLLDPNANPYLDLWSWFLEVVRGGHGSPLEWYGAWTTDATARTNLLLIPLLLVIAFLHMRAGRKSKRKERQEQAALNQTQRAAYQRPIALPQTGNRGPIDKFRQQWIEPITLAGRMVETKDQHIAIGATTGARKTTLIGNLIMQARRPVVYIAGDASPYAFEAMRARGWRVWTADGRNGGLFIMPGTPEEAAQIVTVLLYPPKVQTGTGLQLGMVRGVFREAIRQMDAEGTPRSLPALADALLEAGPPRGLPSKNFEMAKANWISRIDELAAALGPALGDDINVLDCVRSECGVGFDLNAFSDIELASAFGELAVRLTQHAADKTGDFWWIIDELALFDAELLGQIVRTCRIRHVKFVGASQIISDFGKTLRGLVKIWFVGEQTAADEESRTWCSHLTMGLVPPENFAEHATPPGFYYVVANGRTQDLQLPPWHHPAPVQPMRVYAAAPVVMAPTVGRGGDADADAGGNAGTGEGAGWDTEGNDVSEAEQFLDLVKCQPHRIGPVAVPEWVSGRRLAAGQRDRARLAEIWANHVYPYGVDGCYETTYSVNQEGANGRPRCGYMGQSWLVYALVLAVQDGLDLDVVREEMKARKRSADHLCEQNRCVRVEHLRWLTSTGANSQIYQERRRATLRLLQTPSTIKQAPEPLVTAGGNTEGVIFDA